MVRKTYISFLRAIGTFSSLDHMIGDIEISKASYRTIAYETRYELQGGKKNQTWGWTNTTTQGQGNQQRGNWKMLADKWKFIQNLSNEVKTVLSKFSSNTSLPHIPLDQLGYVSHISHIYVSQLSQPTLNGVLFF